MTIPNIWENKIDVPNHQPDMHCLKKSSKFLLQIHFQSVHGYSPLHFVDVLRRCSATGIVHPPVGIAHVLAKPALTPTLTLIPSGHPMGVSINGGSPIAGWLVYKGKSHLEMDDEWGYPYDSGNLHMLLPGTTTRFKAAGSLNSLRCLAGNCESNESGAIWENHRSS